MGSGTETARAGREQAPFRGTTLRVGLVGAGVVSGGYLDFFSGRDDAKLVAVADRSSTARERVRAKYDPPVVVEDYPEVVSRDDVDLVVVCTPHDLHYPIVMAALRAGKNVICEKPIALSLAEADEMLDTARSLGRRFFVALNMRYTARAIMLSKLLADGTLGRVFLAQFSFLGNELGRLSDPKNWKGTLDRAGGGVLLDGGYHLVDLLNGFFGPAKSVQTMGGRCVVKDPNKGEDNVAVQIEYEGGVLAQLTASFTICMGDGPGLMLHTHVFGTEGSVLSTYESDGLTEHMELLSRTGKKVIDLAAVRCPDKNAHFLRCLRTGEPPFVSALDARNAMAVVEAAYASMRTGRKTEVNWRDR